VIEDFANKFSLTDCFIATSPKTRVFPNFISLQSAIISSFAFGFHRKSIEQLVVTARGSFPICARSKIYIPISIRAKMAGPETVQQGRKFSVFTF
jgi:hypothetical protein